MNDIAISLITEDDIRALYPLGNNKDVSWMSGGGLIHPITYEEFRTQNSIAVSKAIGELQSYAIRWGDVAVGSVGYFRRTPDAPLEIGYWIGKDYWGKGIATKAMMLAIDAMKKSGLSGAVFATTIVDNLASRHILSKCSFIEIGTVRFQSRARDMEVEAIRYSITL